MIERCVGDNSRGYINSLPSHFFAPNLSIAVEKKRMPLKWQIVSIFKWALILSSLSFFGYFAFSSSYEEPDHIQKWTSYQVCAGDTLWAIAERTDPKDRPDAVVDQIEKENGMQNAWIVPGQTLLVPVGR